jgi:hypothetical protein
MTLHAPYRNVRNMLDGKKQGPYGIRMAIHNLADAIRASQELAEFLARFQSIVGGGVGTTIRSVDPVSPKPLDISIPQRKKPLNFSEMQRHVIEVIRDSGRPLRAPEIVEAYRQKGWVVRDDAKITITLYGVAANLARKGHLLHGENGFSLAPVNE